MTNRIGDTEYNIQCSDHSLTVLFCNNFWNMSESRRCNVVFLVTVGIAR